MRQTSSGRRALSSVLGVALAASLLLPLVLIVAAATPAAAAPAAAITGDGYTAVTPTRICDTRQTSTTVAVNACEGANGAANPVTAGTPLEVGIGGMDFNGGAATAGGATVPANATAAVLNVTVTGTSDPSYLTVWPKGGTQPTVSNINWTAGQTVPNLVQVTLGTGGKVDVANAVGSTDVIIDLEGYFAEGSPGLFNPLPPVRICDTRSSDFASLNPCGGGNADKPIPAKGTQRVNIVGTYGVPNDATAVVLNVTVTDPTDPSFVTVWPDGASQPTASNLNFLAGETIPNRVTVPVGSDGAIDVYNAVGTVNVVVDLNGYYDPTSGSKYIAFTPKRVCDTRPKNVSGGVIDNPCNDPTAAPIAANSLLPVTNSGVSGVTAWAFNVTIPDTTAGTYVTAFPDNGEATPTVPTISDLNAVPGSVVANLTIVAAGSHIEGVWFYNAVGNTDLVVDLEGVYTESGITLFTT